MRSSRYFIFHVVVAVVLLTVALFPLSVAALGDAASAAPSGSSHWSWCNQQSAKAAPRLFWVRLKEATEQHHDVPSSFWSDVAYRDDIAKIACYESTFEYHAENVGQYGLFQMSSPLIATEGVTFAAYWNGSVVRSKHVGATWYQCTAGERYIHSRYGNPAAAWDHEETYGWY